MTGRHGLRRAGLMAAAGMALLTTIPVVRAAAADGSTARLFFLDIRGARVLSVNPDGSDVRVLTKSQNSGPDGIAVDPAAGYVYWSNMGRAKDNDGSVERARLDGSELTTIVPKGATFTAKQMKLDERHGKMYWSDREGMRVMRANIDGSQVETLVEVATGEAARQDATNWCVGLAVDVEGGKIYWTQKGGDNEGRGSIRRANVEMPKGQTAANRTDIEILFDALPEPIDLDLDVATRHIYWTDRGDAPRGNTVNRAPMDAPSGVEPRHRRDIEVLMRGLNEAIGIALDLKGGRLYVTDLGGSVYSARLDGSDRSTLLTGQGSLTGIAFAELPARPQTGRTTQGQGGQH